MIDFKKLATVPVLAVTFITGGAVAAFATVASAANTDTVAQHGQANRMNGNAPGVAGTITAINGSTLTVTDARDAKIYTVNAGAAAVRKASENTAPVTEALSDLAVGETIMVRGTVSNTTVTATDIVEGELHRGGAFGGKNDSRGVVGTVSAVNGTTVTVTNDNGTTYTVDASSSAVEKHVTGSLSDITVGSHVNVTGAVSGTSVKAKVIMQGAPVFQALGTQK